ncbi:MULTISPECIES: hypothetical protein [unclassified Streptomyces]|uniref:hypothetical protein n=1 Tax=unclassified Streptomyces TaxID=2593676 RepID=UPI000CD4CF6A|nr:MULTISPECIES: hypothetical protein [unclassified Streptomyces]
MALGRYTEVARAANGDLIRAGEVTVLVAGTGDLAQLWQDDAGTVPARNPAVTDLASGAWSAVAEAGLYDLRYPDGRTVHNVPVAGASGGGGDAPSWDDIADKPETFPPTIGATASSAVAGNDPRLSAAAAGTASVRALAGGTATTASASDHTHAGLLIGSATAVNESAEFADLAEATTAYNALLAALRLRGIISGA